MFGANNYKAKTSKVVSSGSVITGSLIVNLDASNSLSYSGTGTTWQDLTGNGNNFELKNGAVYDNLNGGSFILDGSNDYILSARIPSTGDGTKSQTYSIWVNPASTSGNIMSMASTNPQGGWNMPPIAASGQKFSGKFWANERIYSNTYTINNWYQLVLVFDYANASQNFYVNGVLQGSTNGIAYAASGSDNYIFLGQSNPGADNTGMFRGKVAAFQVYQNRALTAIEVLQNFNSTKGRFGF